MPLETVKKVVSIVAKLGGIAGKTLEDGKVSFGDLAQLPDMTRVFVDLISVEWSQVVSNCHQLTKPDCEALVEHFKKEFKLPQAGLEVKIENILTLVVQTAELFIALIKTLRS